VGVSRYIMFLNGVQIVTSTYHILTGLTPGTTYSIFMVAGDLAGNLSVPSDTITPTTLAQVVTEYRMTNLGQGEINLACAIGYREMRFYHNGIGVWPETGDTIFTNSSGTNPFFGEYYVYVMANNNWIQINNEGVVLSDGSCGHVQ
jgi:hypothetical protein